MQSKYNFFTWSDSNYYITGITYFSCYNITNTNKIMKKWHCIPNPCIYRQISQHSTCNLTYVYKQRHPKTIKVWRIRHKNEATRTLKYVPWVTLSDTIFIHRNKMISNTKHVKNSRVIKSDFHLMEINCNFSYWSTNKMTNYLSHGVTIGETLAI